MNSSREYLDMESGSQMIVRKRLREKYCEFLRDPEGYTKRHASTEPTQSTQPSELAESTKPTQSTKSTESSEPTSFAVKHIAQVFVLLVPFLHLIF